jgi:hypothetical protein
MSGSVKKNGICFVSVHLLLSFPSEFSRRTSAFPALFVEHSVVLGKHDDGATVLFLGEFNKLSGRGWETTLLSLEVVHHFSRVRCCQFLLVRSVMRTGLA